MKSVLFATRNKGKLAELKRLLADLPVRVIGLSDLPLFPEVEETGKTFAENALLKARAAVEATGLASIADDSGLIVDALDGRPGIYSARYAGADATDAQRIGKLLAELADLSPANRTARFYCAAAFVDGDRSPVLCEASCEGHIVDAPRGLGGFGYDPIFYSDELGRTFAEANVAEKDSVSHRGKAMRELTLRLASML